MSRRVKLALAGTAAVLLPSVSVSVGLPDTVPISAALREATLSVLTYNVEGLPRPIGWQRSDDLAAIAQRLHQLRSHGAQPHVVLLQEAFSPEARAIGRDAGYRWIIAGPAADASPGAQSASTDPGFAGEARWWHGETEGKMFSSGLMVLSDYPVLRVRRMAFPACAGFDCLANKGAVMVTIAVPGAPTPVDIADTHLNSRHSSHVAETRSLFAWRRQAQWLGDFLNRWHDPAHPLIVAGDFNTGDSPLRWAAFRTEMAGWNGGPFGNALDSVLGARRRAPANLPRDVAAILRRGSDWQYFASGVAASLTPTAISVTFGPDTRGRMLSDHIGYSAVFRFGAPHRGPARG